MSTPTNEAPRGKFRFRGSAALNHIGARKEGPEGEEVLACDAKFVVEDDCAAMRPFFSDTLILALFTDIGAVANPMIMPLAVAYELDNYRVEAAGSAFGGVKVKKFSFVPLDGNRVQITFQISFKPSADEIARLAEYLREDIELAIEPESGELDLGEAGQ